MCPIFGKIGKNLLDLCAIGLIEGGATHSSHLFQPIEFRIWYYFLNLIKSSDINDMINLIFIVRKEYKT
jgi:hypothetical protein